ncbi:hypothetical protein Droror1_Dr00022747 [Drosera rotundifolia]
MHQDVEPSRDKKLNQAWVIQYGTNLLRILKQKDLVPFPTFTCNFLEDEGSSYLVQNVGQMRPTGSWEGRVTTVPVSISVFRIRNLGRECLRIVQGKGRKQTHSMQMERAAFVGSVKTI